MRNAITKAEVTLLMGDANDENTFNDTINIVPLKVNYEVYEKFVYPVLAMSLTVISIKTI